MSIATELQRIKQAKTNMIEGLTESGVELPSNPSINDIATTVNENVLPLIDNRSNPSISIDASDIDIGDKLVITVKINNDATGYLNLKIDAWYNETELIDEGDARFIISTELASGYTHPGNHLITVTYEGDSNYKPGVSTSYVEISKVIPDMLLTVNVDDTMYDIRVQTVRDAGKYSPSLRVGSYTWSTSCILFFIDNYPITSSNITDGTASIIWFVDGYASGTHTIQAMFLGDGKYEPCLSNTYTFTIP